MNEMMKWKVKNQVNVTLSTENPSLIHSTKVIV